MSATSGAEAVVREFWRLMGTNRFHCVQSVLTSDFVLEWPQSREWLRGVERFACMYNGASVLASRCGGNQCRIDW